MNQEIRNLEPKAVWNKFADLDRHFRYVTGEFFVTKGNSYEDIYDEK